MKTNYYLGVVAGLLVAANAFANLTVTLSSNPYSSGSGGEFTATTSGGSFLSGYNASAILGGGFETFCIDTADAFHSSTVYDVTLGSTTTATSGNQISLGTAYLYSQFAAATLGGYNYGAGRVTSAGLLQNTLWALEGEISSTGVFVNSNPFYNLLLTTFGTITAAKADANGLYGVQVMQLTDANSRVGQSMLVETPPNPRDVGSVPEPSTFVAGAMLLLPFGISVARILRKDKIQPGVE